MKKIAAVLVALAVAACAQMTPDEQADVKNQPTTNVPTDVKVRPQMR